MVNKIINSDCIEGLKTLPDESVDCCVTSPPYFGLRDYGHDGQIGLEATPEQFVAKMVEVFTEVKRVLKKEGTLWLNLGDTYSTGSGGGQGAGCKQHTNVGSLMPRAALKGMKSKDLIGIPWMVAFALRSSGWYLRQDIIWHKPNPMPESVTDRCTKAHEYIFLLSKSAKYYYDHEAIAEQSLAAGELRKFNTSKKQSRAIGREASGNENPNAAPVLVKEERNKRSVWTVTPKPFSEAHFATFPEDLIVDCIKAGCPEGGIVLDPFSGAGTTALVASKLNRDFIGFELNPEYIEITKKRLQNELGMFNKLIA
jgi:DNA modification methylase